MTPKNIEIYSSGLRHHILEITQIIQNGNPIVSLSLSDILACLLNDYFVANTEHPDWIAQDTLSVTSEMETLAVDSFFCMLNHSSFDDIISYHKKTKFNDINLNYCCKRKQGNNFAQALGSAFAYDLLQNKYNSKDINIFTNKHFIIADLQSLLMINAVDATFFAGSKELKSVRVIAYNIGDNDNTTVINRFEYNGWHVIKNINGHNLKEISTAFHTANAIEDKPVIIVFNVELQPVNLVDLNNPEDFIDTNLKKYNKAKPITTKQHSLDIFEQWNKTQEILKQQPILGKNLEEQISGDIKIEFSSKATALAEEMQDNTEKPVSVVEGCITAIDLLLAPVASSLVLLYDEQIVKKYLNVIAQDKLPLNVVDMQYFDANRLISNGVSLLPFFNQLTISDVDDVVDILALMLGYSNPKVSHCFINQHKNISQVMGLDFLYNNPENNIWRPCDIVEAIIAIQQSLIQENLFIIADDFTPIEVCERGLENMEAIQTGGYCIFDSNSEEENDSQIAVDVAFIAQGREVYEAISLVEKLNCHSQVWSVPSMRQFFNTESNYQYLISAKNIVVCDEIYWSICNDFLPKNKIQTLNYWLSSNQK